METVPAARYLEGARIVVLGAAPEPTRGRGTIAVLASAKELAELKERLATLADAKTLAVSTAVPSTSTVQEIISTVQTLAPIALALIPGASPFVPVIDAALSLAPALLADIGVTAASPKAIAPKYDQATARLVLRGAAH